MKTVLDTAGEPFLLGLQEKPFLLKPNSMEFEQAFKTELKAGRGPLEVARSVVDSGIPYLCISWAQMAPSCWTENIHTGPGPFAWKPKA